MRVFIAISIPQAGRSALKKFILGLASQLPRGVRWADPEGIHLTLKFLGNVEPSQVAEIVNAMRRSTEMLASFPIQISGLGMFPNERRPRVLWAGMEGDLDSLGELQEKVEEAMSSVHFPREQRPFSPHLTLGRVREPVSNGIRRQIAAAISSASPAPAEPWLVESVHLVQSNLAPGGASYTNLASAPLDNAGHESQWART